ncbi:hypothetical protein TWF694_004133 [Orbilia ellipsospora]|uniref:Uncharacterized protein n=1 Tax=Orbilia ellipsospora TaxID=2528407 RepID=A0AAV9WX59_9PEZI
MKIHQRDFDHEDLDHYKKPARIHKWVIVLICTCLPILVFLLLLCFRNQINWLWVKLRSWSVGMPAPENTKYIEGEDGAIQNAAERAKAEGTAERNVVLPFQDQGAAATH